MWFVLSLYFFFKRTAATGIHTLSLHAALPICFAGVPLSTVGDLGLAVAVDVAHGDADVVTRGEVLDDDVFFPGRVFVPGDVAGVAQDDVRFFVAVHVGDGGAVADLDVGVDGDVPELGQVGGLAKRGPAEKGEIGRASCRERV